MGKQGTCSIGINRFRYVILLGVFVFALSVITILSSSDVTTAETCECKICHGNHHGEGWSGCDICHGNPPVQNTYSREGLVFYPSQTGALSAGAHEKHATPLGMNYACDTCHYLGMPASPIAGNYKLQIGSAYMNLAGAIYDGRVLNSPYSYEGTNGITITTGGTLRCSGIYCHSNGTSVSAGVVPFQSSPSWTASGPLACTSCHGYPPLYSQDQPKANSHYIHRTYSCNMCHFQTTSDGVTITNKANHVNALYDVFPGPDNTRGGGVTFTYTWDPGGGRCFNITCHGGTGHLGGGSTTWGAVYYNAQIAYTYGPQCYQVNFTGSAYGGTSSPPYTFSWDFGDGDTGSGSSVSHLYPFANTYYPKLTVRDSKNHVATAQTQVIPQPAANVSPVAAKNISVSAMTVTLTDLSYDPDYNTCGHSGPGTINILWGDGSTLLQSINLTNTPSSQVYSRTYAVAGTYTVQHFITDNSGKTVGSGSVPVTVSPPSFNISGRVTNANTGAGIRNVQVVLKASLSGGYSYFRYTDINGNYSFTNVPQQCWYVVPNSPTYYTYSPTYVGPVCATATNVDFTAR